MQGIGEINKFKISKIFDKNLDRLPTAHTCTNQLELPDYPNKELLYERLTLAISEGKNGFGFVYLGTNKAFRKTADVRQKIRNRKIEKKYIYLLKILSIIPKIA